MAQVFDQEANQKFHCLIMIGICGDAQYRRVLRESWAGFCPLYENSKGNHPYRDLNTEAQVWCFSGRFWGVLNLFSKR